MAGYNWMDDRERAIREREGRGFSDYRSRADEERTWDSDERPDPYAARRSGQNRDRVFGERDTGAGYNRGSDVRYGGANPASQGGYGQTGRYGQNRDDLGGDRYGSGGAYGGGRDYGDDGRERVYRAEYGVYSFNDGFSPTRARYHAQGYGRPGYGDYADYRREASDRMASGGTGGYDYERGYGDGGRGDGGRSDRDFGDRMERAGHDAGAFLRRTGRKVADWFNASGEGRAHDDLDATAGGDRGAHRGRGPQGYKRADERISEDAHERLTDDPWLDASEISVSVSGGEVTLSGTVQHREAKHRAERIVEDISGVTHVQNNLRVAKGNYFTTPGSGYGDSVLGAQIRDAEAEGAPAEGVSPLSPAVTNGGKKV